MGGDPSREPPFFFMKPADTIQQISDPELVDHPYPAKTTNYHFEVEMVAALSQGGRDISVEKALECVFGYAIGIDMTRRDLQNEAKELRRPWELAKGADYSAPIGPIYLAEETGHPQSGAISLAVNGVKKQQADLAGMIWSVAEQIAYLSQYFELKPGDLIFSGTPEGVGPIEKGQTMTAMIDGLGEINLRVV